MLQPSAIIVSTTAETDKDVKDSASLDVDAERTPTFSSFLGTTPPPAVAASVIAVASPGTARKTGVLAAIPPPPPPSTAAAIAGDPATAAAATATTVAVTPGTARKAVTFNDSVETFARPQSLHDSEHSFVLAIEGRRRPGSVGVDGGGGVSGDVDGADRRLPEDGRDSGKPVTAAATVAAGSSSDRRDTPTVTRAPQTTISKIYGNGRAGEGGSLDGRYGKVLGGAPGFYYYF